MKVVLRPEVAPDAVDVHGDNGLTLELRVDERTEGVYLYGVCRSSVSELDGVYIGENNFTRWVRSEFKGR